MGKSQSAISRSPQSIRSQNTLETEKPLSQGRKTSSPRMGRTATARFIDMAHTVASSTADILSNATTGVIDEITGQASARRQARGAYDGPLPTQSQNEGGVMIPSYAEFAQQEEQKRIQFFQERQREAEQHSLAQMKEDRRKIDEIHEMLRKEIDKYEKAQRKMDENLEKIKKMLILEQQQVKAGIYHISHAEVLVMMFRTFLANVTESNTWLEALISRKSKRGSLFAVRSKKSGTQYSMSQELSIARSSG